MSAPLGLKPVQDCVNEIALKWRTMKLLVLFSKTRRNGVSFPNFMHETPLEPPTKTNFVNDFAPKTCWCAISSFRVFFGHFHAQLSYIDLNRWIDDSWVEDTWGKMKNSESLVTGLCGRALAPGFVYSFQRRGLDVWADGCSASCVLWMSDMRGRSWMEILQPLVFVSSNGIPSTMI